MRPCDADVDGFLDSVSEVTRLIDGLKAGTLPVEYVDKKIAERHGKQSSCKSPPALPSTNAATAAADGVNVSAPLADGAVADADATQAARQAELQRKLEELKASRQCKLRARQLYDSYVQDKGHQAQQQQKQQAYATDYTQWDLWCPSDDEDDMFNSLTPNTPQFRAMERDISSRHERMVEQRQLAERQRQLGNAAFKAGQFSEALRCYEAGLEVQRHNMALHANAAMAALKLQCFVQAQEHCDKVLHLAEVLYDTPKHPLCVKALQRRAVAYQALGQHSRAVADLEAAADILPADEEVSSQLQRARALLQEHRTVRQLTRLVSPAAAQDKHSGTAAAGPQPSEHNSGKDLGSSNSTVDPEQAHATTPKSGGDVTRLQRIKQLVTDLAAGAGGTGAAAAQVAICTELQGLVRDARLGLFFRECGGLAAAAKLVTSSNDATALAACLRLLTSACEADTALEQLAQQQQHALGAAWDLSCSTQPDLAAAAVELVHAASASSAVRPQLCRQLQLKDSKPTQASSGGGGVGAGGSNGASKCGCGSRLARVWAVCCSQAGSGDKLEVARQVLLWSLLSNCMLVPGVRAAMGPVLQQQPESLQVLCARLPAIAGVAASKLYGLCSNMASCPVLRRQLAGCQPLMQELLRSAAASPAALLAQQHAAAAGTSRGRALAALACLCNLSVEASVQLQLAEHPATMHALLQLAVAPAGLLAAPRLAAGTSDTSSSSSSSTSASSTGGQVRGTSGPRLPARSRGDTAAAGPGRTSPPAPTPAAVAADAMLAAERAACVLSRAAKQPAGAQLLQRETRAVALLVEALAAAAPGQRDAGVAGTEGSAQGWVAAAVRTLALLTVDGSCCAASTAAQAAAGIALCCRLLRCDAGAVDDGTMGNAALVLGHYAAAGRGQWHPQLAKADAVGALVAAARAGRGGPASRNAGIALSRLAMAGGAFLERLRELRGLEVIYEYVKQP